MKLEKIITVIGAIATSALISGCDTIESALCPPQTPPPCVCNDTRDAGSKSVQPTEDASADAGSSDGDIASDASDAGYISKTKGNYAAVNTKLPITDPTKTEPARVQVSENQLIIHYDADSWRLEDEEVGAIRRFVNNHKGIKCFTVEGYAGREVGEPFGDRAAIKRAEGVALRLRNFSAPGVKVQEYNILNDELAGEPRELHNTAVIKAYCD